MTIQAPAPTSHPASLASPWPDWLHAIEQAMQAVDAQAQRTVVLVPFAQLMNAGRRAWLRSHTSGFAPRFESTRNWAHSLQPFAPAATDLSGDMAHDSLVAASFIDQVVPRRADTVLRSVMVTRLVEAARELAPLAAAQPPDARAAWAASLRESVATGLQALQWESLVQSLALVWVGNSAFATDVLWIPVATPGADADLLLVLPGWHPDPLADALLERWGARAQRLPLNAVTGSAGTAPRLHPCDDAEDEAQRAAACVITHLQAGRTPVGLVVNDRVLTRRVNAMLQAWGVAVQDETGWKLSTTHAAAQLMSLLRAAQPRARTDDVLDFLKQSPAWDAPAIERLEHWAREQGVSRWHAARAETANVCPVGLPALLDALHTTRTLAVWLQSLAAALDTAGLLAPLREDGAGQQVLQSLRLEPGGASEIAVLHDTLAASSASHTPAQRLSLAAFTAWVREVLESASFAPRSAVDAEVITLPLAQLLGRELAAVVMPGCDETQLSPSPEPPGQWSAPQREMLGLPSRDRLAEAAALAWQGALRQPQIDLLWRTQARGEAVLPSPWVQALWSAGLEEPDAAPDPRPERELTPQPQSRPQPMAGDLLPSALSASAYQDLRDCPYRFFALRQLRLQDAPELDAEPDQRDLGNWLHAVLRAFHEQRGDARPGTNADRSALDTLAEKTTEVMGLNTGEGGAGFLPFQAQWPALREGYLTWLAGFEAPAQGAGPRFERAEAALTLPLGEQTLLGKLDRIDSQTSPQGPIPIVIDYKTESRDKTKSRIKEPLEDTQLAFYAALMPAETLRAAYLSITDARAEPAALLLEQSQILLARERLLQGLAHDMSRLASGAPMPALGEARVCEFCAARGLCRKDHWSAP
ncbi:MAG: ATP-dependent helicase/nuclease subunit B [Hydrogenophaga sp.]|jgi:ATP-dependent helicase/nuclease subunit B